MTDVLDLATRAQTAQVLDSLLDTLADLIAERVADRLPAPAESDPRQWLNTQEAIEYTRLREGTFRHLMAAGRIPAHGGKSKVFHRPELDEAVKALGRSGALRKTR